MISKITQEDMKQLYDTLTEKDRNGFNESSILITGFAGSIGYGMMMFFHLYGRKLKIKKVYAVDNYQFGKPEWLSDIEKNDIFQIVEDDVTTCSYDFAKDATYVFHMASLASPVFYRKNPIKTMDADAIGIRRLLDFYVNKPVKGILFFSSSEIYGNPSYDQIPTKESYWGNVNCVGPRACYDESKRYGETTCYNYHNIYKSPVRIVRPFNNYGPGLRKNDERVMADFGKNLISKENITVFSTGRDTRSFLYNTDALLGYFRVVMYENFDVFNIGSDEIEITISQLAELFQQVGEEVFGYKSEIEYKVHEDPHYLTDNPKRRLPDLEKAKTRLDFKQTVPLRVGIERYLRHLTETENKQMLK